MNERRFFHYSPSDDNFYHVTCSVISRDSISLDDHNYDHGFFYDNSAANYYVTAKLIPRSLVADILNHGMGIYINSSNRNQPLSLYQKLRLEQDLRQII